MWVVYRSSRNLLSFVLCGIGGRKCFLGFFYATSLWVRRLPLKLYLSDALVHIRSDQKNGSPAKLRTITKLEAYKQNQCKRKCKRQVLTNAELASM
eukprot:3389093-Amphidinium_carterae.1